MEEVRFLQNDENELYVQSRELCKLAFPLDDAFFDYFFQKRTFLENTLCKITDGKVVSTLQAIPVRGTAFGREIKTILVSCVCTHPDFRGKGIMRELFSYLHQSIDADAFVLQPAENMFPFYEKLGYEPLGERFTVKRKNTSAEGKRQIPPSREWMYKVYNDFAQGFDTVFGGERERIDGALEECQYCSNTFIAYTDSAYAFCVENEGLCEVLYVIGKYTDELYEAICKGTECDEVMLLLAENMQGAFPIKFNMIHTPLDVPEFGRVLSNLYY